MITVTARNPWGAAAQTLHGLSGQATGNRPVYGPFTSWGQSEGISHQRNVPWKNNKIHIQTYTEQTTWTDEWGISFHYLGTDCSHSLGKRPTFLPVILALSWIMCTASAYYLHYFTVNCAAELPGSCVGSPDDSLRKQRSALGWRVGSWRETEIGAKLPEGCNPNQSFLFHAAGRTKGARSKDPLVVKIALQG